ncbi:MAG: sugar ABC transporter permease [Chloroflexi bacterium]|nr:MAG: sugar ABC transporter permease [Chloroflexota bacterium]
MTIGQTAERLQLPTRERTTRTSRRAALLWERLQGYGFLSPALLLLLLFHLLPVFYALFLSLFDARVFRDMWQPGRFIGSGNYGRLLTTSEFAQSLTNTVWFALITVPLGLFLAVLFAQLLNARIWGRTGYRVTYFLPYITSTVAAAVVWRWIFQPRVGVANSVLQWLGLPAQQWADEPRGVVQLFGQLIGVPLEGWAAGPSLALVTIALVSVWYSVGFNTVIALADLTTIPTDLYEAARIDGANRWHLFRHITLPLLTPTLLFLLIVETIRSFQSFDFFYQMMAAVPVPGAKVVTIYLYEQGFKSFNLGYAAAIGMVLFAIIFVLTLLQFRATRSRVVYAD